MYYDSDDKNIAEFLVNKTIVAVECRRDNKKYFKNSLKCEVPAQSITFVFDDDSSITIDAWSGLFGKEKKQNISYITCMPRNELGIALMPVDLKSYISGDLRMISIREPTPNECRKRRLKYLRSIKWVQLFIM